MKACFIIYDIGMVIFCVAQLTQLVGNYTNELKCYTYEIALNTDGIEDGNIDAIRE